MSTRFKLSLIILSLVHATTAYAARSNPEEIIANQMRSPAGTLVNGVLTLRLDARDGVWRPFGATKPPLSVAAFAEEGKPLQNPGPLVRVLSGTDVRITIRNSLKKRMWVFGLGEKRGLAGDSALIEPGATREFSFKAGAPGIFYYTAKTMDGVPVLDRYLDDSQLNGAIVIEAPNAKPLDRLFMISWYGDIDTTAVSGLAADGLIAVNGLAWPHTERIHATQGDEMNWGWVSVTNAPHPMHLHGFYFTLNGTGDGATFTELAPDKRPPAVTNVVVPGGAMSITWTPVRPGNWIMHCHIAGHMTSIEGLNKDKRYPEPGHAHAKSQHDGHYMSDLIVGIIVAPKGEQKASSAEARQMRLLIRSKPKIYGEYAGYAYVLGGSDAEKNENALPVPGPTLYLEKDQPVAITIVNHSHDPAAVHWHGIELESFPDGVPGVSGYGNNLLPSIPPHDSLTVRFTPPRSGTFMYHSHSNELQQIGSGLYGAIIVHEPGQKPDPATDRILMLTDASPMVNLVKDFPAVFLNGTETPAPLEFKAGTKYRLRVINIRSERMAYVRFSDGDQTLMWRPLARDGADLPESQRELRPAELRFGPGQIFDYEFIAQKPGDLKLTYGYAPPPPAGRPKPNELLVRVTE